MKRSPKLKGRTGRGLLVVVTLAAGLAACGGSTDPAPEPLGLTMEDVAGSYAPTEFTATVDTSATDDVPPETTDLLAEGAELELTLAVDGRTAGRLFIPRETRPLEEDAEEDLEADLSGSWTLRSSDGSVEFDFGSDVFLEAGRYSADASGLILGGADLSVLDGVGFDLFLRR